MKLLYLVESGKSKFLVFDEMPDKISTKYGDDTIIGRIGGVFYDFLAKRNERREAFGGRKFDIVLDNGEIEKCEGQWWDAVTDRAREELEKEGNPLSKMVLIGKLPYSIGLNYLRNLQEMSVTAVDDLMGLKERSREEAFNIIQEWTKEFTEKYGNYYFDGSYYDEIDAFIEEKLRTI